MLLDHLKTCISCHRRKFSYFLLPLLCFDIIAVVDVGIDAIAFGGLSVESTANESVNGDQGDGDHRKHREDDYNGKHPAWVILCLCLGEIDLG